MVMSLPSSLRNMPQQTLIGYLPTYKSTGRRDFVLDQTTMEARFTNVSSEDTPVFLGTRDGVRIWIKGESSEEWTGKTRWKFPSALVKSCLQKAIRRQRADMAAKSLTTFMAVDPLACLRRIGVIAIEDVEPLDGYATVVWMMMAHNMAPITMKMMMFLRHYVTRLCAHKGCYGGITRAIKETRESIAEKSPDTSTPLAIFHRMNYGGMRGDMIMLQEAASVYCSRKIKEAPVPQPFPTDWSNVWLAPEDFEDTTMRAGVDFHPYPWLLQKLSEECGLPKEEIKLCIWEAESGMNTRQSYWFGRHTKALQSDTWEKIREPFEQHRICIVSKIVTDMLRAK